MTDFWDDKYHHYASEIREQIIVGYQNKEKYEKLLTNLEGLWSANSITEEVYIKLKNEYTEQLQKEKKHIGHVKAQATVHIKECNKYIEQISSEILTIDTRYKIGEYSKEEFDRITLPFETQRQLFESVIKTLRNVHDVKSSSDAQGLLRSEETATGTASVTNGQPTEHVPTTIERATPESPISEEPPSVPEPDIAKAPPLKKKTSEGCWLLVTLALISILIIGLIVWGLVALFSHGCPGPTPIGIGYPAPELSLQDIDGNTVNLSDLRGRTILLYEWWISCPPCEKDLSLIQKTCACTDNKSLTIVAINTMDSASSIRDFANKNNYEFLFLTDYKGEFERKYQFPRRGSAPNSVIVDPSGKITGFRFGGFTDADDLGKFIASGLSSPLDYSLPLMLELPSVTSITANSAIVNWLTDKKSLGQILLRNPDGITTTVGDDGTLSFAHTIKLDGLSPCTSYSFNLSYAGACSNWASFMKTFVFSTTCSNMAPDFTLKGTTGVSTHLKDLLGKKILLHFWLSGCPACENELPLLQQFYDNWPHEEVEIVAVNVRGDKDAVADFVTKHGYTFNVLLDTEGKVDDLYSNPDFPTTYLLDTDGTIISTHEGAFQSYQEISDFIGERAPVCTGKPGYDVGNMPSDFHLLTYDGGKEVSLSGLLYNNPKLLIAFLQTSCETCRVQLRYMQDLYSDSKSNGWEMVLIAERENPEKLSNLINSMNITFPVLLDPDGTTADKYHASNMPYLVLVDRSGCICSIKNNGFASTDELKSYMDSCSRK